MVWTRRDIATILLQSQASLPEANTPSKVYVFQNLPVHHTQTLDYRQILASTTVEGCKFSVHESSLAPNMEPHPPHRHNGEEMFLVLEGVLEVTINGKTEKLTRGSVGFVGSGDEHGIRNLGDTPAKYYVIELGPQH
jgi:quercetin dioxygenase-like cupin family protein